MNRIEKILRFRNSSVLYGLLCQEFSNQRRNYALAIFFMAIMAGTTAASAWIIRDVSDSIVLDQDLSKVLFVSFLIVMIFTLKGFSTYFQAVFLTRAGNAIVASHQITLYERLVSQSLSFNMSVGTSETLVTVTEGPRSLSSLVEIIITSFIRDFFTVCGLIAIMFYQQPYSAFIVILMLPIVLLVLRSLIKKVRDIMRMELASLDRLFQICQETSQGFKVIKTFALENFFSGQMRHVVHSIEKRSNTIGRTQAVASPLMETLSGFTIAAVVALSGILVLEGKSTPGVMMSFITALLLAYAPAKKLADMRVRIEASMAGVQRMQDFMAKPYELLESEYSQDIEAGPREIIFENVSFQYKDDVPVIRGANVTFRGGKTTALVGPSGGGKTTLINLLMRLYVPSSGRIMIDGQDIRLATSQSLRSTIGYVEQDTFLFSGTVASNIRLGCQEADEESIISAAKSANAHQFIKEMPLGYQSDVGEGGRNLSGGQKQRISIARALLKNPDILVLDEATSGLDSKSDYLIRDALYRLMKGRTTIIIAHRLSTIMTADQVLYLDKGQIVEQGSLDKLINNNGPFRVLFDSQHFER